MSWVVLLVLMVVVCLPLCWVLPHPVSRGRRRLRPLAERITERFGRHRAPAADPFETLWLQTRLGHLASEIRRIEAAPGIYARAHRLMALEAAYDNLLDEACRLAGVPDQADLERGEQKRWAEEQELTTRGWSW